MSATDLALHTGSILFVAWALLFSALIVLWAWSRLGAPLLGAWRAKRSLARHRARRQSLERLESRRPAVVATAQRQAHVNESATARHGSAANGSRARSLVVLRPLSVSPLRSRPGVSPRWKALNRVAV